MNIALILSSGVGARFGGNVPKQYILLNGKEVIEYVLNAAKAAKSVDKIVVVANSPYTHEIAEKYEVETTEGGATRNVSFRNGIDYIKAKYECKNLIVLDAVRPFITPKIIDEYFDKLKDNEVCVTSSKITDSLNCLDIHICDRDRYFLTCSPMSFDFKKLDRYLDANSKNCEVLQIMPADTKTFYYYGFTNNYKITYAYDVPLYEAMMKIATK